MNTRCRYHLPVRPWIVLGGAVALVVGTTARAEPDATTTGKPAPPLSDDEAFAKTFSLSRAHTYLGNRAIDWGETHGCITCHTNGLYLVSGQAGSESLQAVQEFAREYLREQVGDGESAGGSITGIVASTALLTISESRSAGGELHPTTRRSLDYIWTQQNESGCWDWLKCNWPPYEVDDHFGATLVAVAVGSAPASYRETPAAEAGLKRTLRYLSDHPPTTMHQRGMLVWAAAKIDGILSDAERQSIVDDLFALQRPDGGWNVITLGTLDGIEPADQRRQGQGTTAKAADDREPTWVRTDGGTQDATSSDGYATGFAVFILRQAGVDARDPRIERGVAWLKTHQRASGRWFTPIAAGRQKAFHLACRDVVRDYGAPIV